MEAKEKILISVYDERTDCFMLGDGIDFFDGKLSSVYKAMERYSNLRIIEVLGKITAVPDFGEGVNIYLDGLELSQRISELKSQLPLSTEDSNNDIPNSVGGGF